MKTMLRIFSLMPLFVLSFSICVGAQVKQGSMETEKVEWTWADRPEHPDKSVPNVLLVGDSITRAYYPQTAKDLEGVANVYLFATSCSSGDPRLAGQLRDYFAMAGVRFAAIHFNNGMHGWGYSEAQYSGGLPSMIAVLRAKALKAKLFWATTTSVRKDAPDVERTNARVEERNRLANTLMSREHIAIDDQYELMKKHQNLHSDDVHFTSEGSSLQAQQVSVLLRKALRPGA